MDRREWHIGRLEVSVGTSFNYHRLPYVWSCRREEILLAAYWHHRYVALCWLPRAIA